MKEETHMEVRIAYLRPAQIISRLKESPVVFVPLAPLEWHGPHLPMGVDAFNAQHVALAGCRKVGGLVWPTLFWGTERERSEQELKNLGFEPDRYVVGMDFPNNSLPSAYCAEEILALVVRETLKLVERLGAALAVIVNGHGAINHNEVLKRLAVEFNNTSSLKVHVRIALRREEIDAGAIGHAAAGETSLMMYHCPETVELTALPPKDQPMRYRDFAIVDGPGFEGKGHPHKIVENDPRTEASAALGRELFETTVEELAAEVRSLLKQVR